MNQSYVHRSAGDFRDQTGSNPGNLLRARRCIPRQSRRDKQRVADVLDRSAVPVDPFLDDLRDRDADIAERDIGGRQGPRGCSAELAMDAVPASACKKIQVRERSAERLFGEYAAQDLGSSGIYVGRWRRSGGNLLWTLKVVIIVTDLTP